MSWISSCLKRNETGREVGSSPNELVKESETREIESSGAGFSLRVLTTVGIVTAVVLSVLLLWYVAQVLLLIFAGILLAIFLRGIGNWVSRHTRLSHGWSLAVVIFVLITPLVQERAASLPPALTFTAQIVMGLLLGIPGLILATPFAAAMLVLVKMLYVEDVLGDRIQK